jgi:diaminohydroxyphosphoribosylaminopyrimidine deaminase / 5-amino-6-(5-phosphoribosylamino)uracil reductase
MRLALSLAETGRYTARPNPRVGCVLAHGSDIVGTGWHQKAGLPHAEAHALAMAGPRARGATAYVTLEPCAHFGRTPPCANALIDAGVARVVAACLDPFPKVAGSGLVRLQSAGIATETGLMQAQARALNAGFFSRIERARPWLRLKMAMSVDGRTALANGKSQWLTGPAARTDVHRWRAGSCAILTGISTVLADDPSLDVRLGPNDVPPEWIPPPLKVIVDRQLRMPLNAKVFSTPGALLIAHGPRVTTARQHLLRDKGAMLFCLPSEVPLQLQALMQELAAREINEVHGEVGATLAGACLQAGLTDELLLYQAPILLGDSAMPLFKLPMLTDMSSRWHLDLLDQCVFGDDWRMRYRVRVR